MWPKIYRGVKTDTPDFDTQNVVLLSCRYIQLKAINEQQTNKLVIEEIKLFSH